MWVSEAVLMKMKEKGTQTDFVLLINRNLQTPSPPPIMMMMMMRVVLFLCGFHFILKSMYSLTHSLSHPIYFFFFLKKYENVKKSKRKKEKKKNLENWHQYSWTLTLLLLTLKFLFYMYWIRRRDCTTFLRAKS